jgi:hypothetical protein
MYIMFRNFNIALAVWSSGILVLRRLKLMRREIESRQDRGW